MLPLASLLGYFFPSVQVGISCIFAFRFLMRGCYSSWKSKPPTPFMTRALFFQIPHQSKTKRSKTISPEFDRGTKNAIGFLQENGNQIEGLFLSKQNILQTLSSCCVILCYCSFCISPFFPPSSFETART